MGGTEMQLSLLRLFALERESVGRSVAAIFKCLFQLWIFYIILKLIP